MTILRAFIVFILLETITGCSAAETTCHLTENIDKGVIYRECGSISSKINFDYDVFVVSLSEDIPSEAFAILWQTPKESQMSDERYFILDYKNMIVYDNTCLGGNFIMLNDQKQIVFEKYGSNEDIVFEQDSYGHCRLPLETWVRTQKKW